MKECMTCYHPVSNSLCFVEHFLAYDSLITLVQEGFNTPLEKKTHTMPPKWEEWELRNKRKCSSHCHHPAPLSGLTLTLKWEWPHHTFSQIIINDMILTPSDSFFFPPSWAVLHFAGVCGSVPLLSGPPDSTLTVRQRSRKMAVIHFVPRHRQGSFSLLPITSRPDSESRQDTAPFPLWPRPAVLQGAEVSGRPTLDSVSTSRNHPRHSTPPPGILQKMAAS